jgi:MFS family permease
VSRTRTWLGLLLVAAVYLALAWPGAARRGVIAEEVTPYLARHPVVLTATADGVAPLPPHDAPPTTGWVRTAQWPNLAWQGDHRTWPLLIRGYQSALGTHVGILLGPVLGDGIAGVRRSSVLLGLALLLLVAALARRLTAAWWTPGLAALLCALSPGLLFFSRTGYGFELASRVAMLLALLCAAPRRPLTPRRTSLLILCITLALLSRATIAATLLPALAVLLIHPQRWPGPRRLLLIAIGFALPVLILLAVSLGLGMAPGTDPTAKLALDPLAARTLLAPETLLAQLAWVVDGRIILTPLLRGVPLSSTLLLALPGLAVLLLAAVRWWHARAGDGECMFLAAALGNALFGAWLYGDPQQFQLGMALEPLFALCLADQLLALRARFPRLLIPTLAVILTLRAHQTLDLLRSERQTTNPMLSGAAQRALVAVLDAHPTATVITTAYNHVGMLETWSNEHLEIIHAWRALRADDDPAHFTRTWLAILRAHDPRFIVLSAGPNLFEGPYTDNTAAHAGLESALPLTHHQLHAHHTFPCESGTPCLELLELRRLPHRPTNRTSP